jgi:putative peptidoglycan lipid II flippase
MAATLLSKVIGLGREQLALYVFGGSHSHDAFIAAFKIPNALRNLLAEGAFSAAFIPIFSALLVNKTKEEAYAFANKVISLLLIVSIAVTVVGFLFVSTVMPVLYKYGPKLYLAVELSRIMMPFVIFVSLSAIIMGILNSLHHFLFPALAPLFANIAFIAVLIFTHKKYGVSSLSYAVLISGVFYFVTQLPSAFKRDFKLKLNFRFKDENIKKFLKAFFPIAFGMAVFQVNLLVSVRFSSPFEGAVVAIDKTFIIMQLILSVFVTGISTVSLPAFSRFSANGNWEKFKDTFVVGIRMVFFFTIPGMLGMMALNTDIVALIFRDIFQILKGSSGRINPKDIVNMGNCLFFFAPAMVSFGCVVILNRAFQGIKKYYIPFVTGVLSVIVNVLLIKYFISTSLGFIGIPFAITLSSFFNMAMLATVLRRILGGFRIKELFDSGAKILLAATIMASVARLVKRKLFNLWFIKDTGGYHMFVTSLIILISACVYILILYVLKEKDLIVIVAKIKRRLGFKVNVTDAELSGEDEIDISYIKKDELDQYAANEFEEKYKNLNSNDEDKNTPS